MMTFREWQILSESAGRFNLGVKTPRSIGVSGSKLAEMGFPPPEEAEEAERRTNEFHTRSTLFIEALDIDDVIAHLLVAEGFSRVEEISESTIDELNEIEGFEEEISKEIQQRAQNWLSAKAQELKDKQSGLGIKDDLMTAPGLRPEQIIKLGENGIKTLDDLADLAADELMEIMGPGQMSNKEANEVIMQARAHWFEEEKQ